MTLDAVKINQTVCIKGICKSSAETRTALQEFGIFRGERICKLCENRSKCAIFKLHNCNRIMLHSEFTKFVEVEELAE